MKTLLLLFIPLALAGASCVQLPEQFTAKPIQQTVTEVTGQHYVLDFYSNRDEQDTLTYHDQVEIWYAPDLGARTDFFSFDDAGKPMLTHRAFFDVTAGQLYSEVTAEQISSLQADHALGQSPLQIAPGYDHLEPYIEEAVDSPTPNNTEFIDELLKDITSVDQDWINTSTEDYTVTQRTTQTYSDGSSYDTIKEFTIDHVTHEIQAVTERNPTDNRAYFKVEVISHDTRSYDPTFFTLEGWRKSLSDPNLPLESELLKQKK